MIDIKVKEKNKFLTVNLFSNKKKVLIFSLLGECYTTSLNFCSFFPKDVVLTMHEIFST